MDTIFLRNLCFSGIHGAKPEEKLRPQRFGVNIEIHVSDNISQSSDDLLQTVDYGLVRKQVRAIIENSQSKNLIETLAEEIAEKILEEQRIRSLTVSVEKLDIWDNGVPGVVIFRTNKKLLL
jgi:dihydroneopterin aldolase